MKLSILLYGIDENSPEMLAIMNKLQNQLNQVGPDKVEVVYRVNQEEGIEEKRAWLLSQALAKKYVFITDDSTIDDNFTILRLSAVKLRKPTKELVELGIFSK